MEIFRGNSIAANVDLLGLLFEFVESNRFLPALRREPGFGAGGVTRQVRIRDSYARIGTAAVDPNRFDMQMQKDMLNDKD